MIIYHEGLPRSGKSYECMVFHVIPALKAGRVVYARVDGLDYEKIAELAGITLERCQELLIHIPEDDVPTIYDVVTQNDALVIIDELQNYWPKGRAALPDPVMKFIAEHGHKGLDIVIMGQDMTDIHGAWIKRTERKLMFLKLTAIGQENRYSWTAYSAVKQKDGRPPKWVKAADGVRKYDTAYFGTYKSHVDGVENKGAYNDGRFVIWNRKSLRYGAPAVLVCAVLLVWWLVKFFTTPDAMMTEQSKKSTHTQTKSQVAPVSSATATETKTVPKASPTPSKPKVPKDVQDDYFYLSMQRSTPNLTYVMRVGNRLLDILVEMRDKDDNTVESWTMQDIISQGWTLRYRSFGIEAKKSGYIVLLRERPVVYVANTSVVNGPSTSIN